MFPDFEDDEELAAVRMSQFEPTLPALPTAADAAAAAEAQQPDSRASQADTLVPIASEFPWFLAA